MLLLAGGATTMARLVFGRFATNVTGFLYHLHYDNKTFRNCPKCVISVFIYGRCDDDGWSDDGWSDDGWSDVWQICGGDDDDHH